VLQKATFKGMLLNSKTADKWWFQLSVDQSIIKTDCGALRQLGALTMARRVPLGCLVVTKDGLT